jgi:hypothetical protein
MSAMSFLSSVEHVKATLVGQKFENPPFLPHGSEVSNFGINLVMTAARGSTGDAVSPRHREMWSGLRKTAEMRFPMGRADQQNHVALEQPPRHLLAGNQGCASHVPGLCCREGIAPVAFAFRDWVDSTQPALTAVEGQP